MAYSHVAHDCRLGDQIVMANCATLGGHVELGDWVIMGGLSAVHQFTKIGAHSFLAHNAAVTRDVPPYVMAVGRPAVPHSVNSEGLKRRGFTAEQIQNIRRAYRVLYRSGLKLSEAMEELDRRGRIAGGDPAVRRVHQAKLAQHRPLDDCMAPLRVGLVAGEASGDTLGAGLIEALARGSIRRRSFFGVAGPKMRAAGCEMWEPAESLAVMGLFEMLRDLPRLLRLLRASATPLPGGAARRVRRHRCPGHSTCGWRAPCAPRASRRCST